MICGEICIKLFMLLKKWLHNIGLKMNQMKILKLKVVKHEIESYEISKKKWNGEKKENTLLLKIKSDLQDLRSQIVPLSPSHFERNQHMIFVIC